MTERFTTVTRIGFGSRIIGSIFGALFGLIMLVAAFLLTVWNEGRAVQTFRGLAEGLTITRSVAAGRTDPANEGRLIHVTAQAVTGETLRDATFGVEVGGSLRLRRKVEMYQWQETTRSRTTQELGGSERRETTYEYDKVWQEDHIDSSRFEYSAGHENPPASVESQDFQARRVTAGAFEIPERLIRQLGGFEQLPISDLAIRESNGFTIDGDYLAEGDLRSPEVGDERISFLSVPEMDVAVVGRQSGTSFAPYRTSEGTDLLMIYPGRLSVQQVYDKEETKQTWITWLLRGLGFLLLFFGLALVLRPIAVFGSVIPFLGSLAGASAWLAAFLLALPIWLITVATGWIAYRPLGAAAMIAAGLLVSTALILARRPRRQVG